jgi:hypothetical protein
MNNLAFSSCAVDIGSPKLGNIGWAINFAQDDSLLHGNCLDDLAVCINSCIKTKPLLLTLDAPLFVPLRSDIKLATKGRNGEGRSPWSAGAGAQVLSMNIPIMTYIFRKIISLNSDVSFIWSRDDFKDEPNLIYVAEALISGKVKGETHEEDAIIMANYCYNYTKLGMFPENILLPEEGVEYINLVAVSLLTLGHIEDLSSLRSELAIYRPQE